MNQRGERSVQLQIETEYLVDTSPGNAGGESRKIREIPTGRVRSSTGDWTTIPKSVLEQLMKGMNL